MVAPTGAMPDEIPERVGDRRHRDIGLGLKNGAV